MDCCYTASSCLDWKLYESGCDNCDIKHSKHTIGQVLQLASDYGSVWIYKRNKLISSYSWSESIPVSDYNRPVVFYHVVSNVLHIHL